MIYATMCIGNELVTKYKHIIDNFSKENTLHVLGTDSNAFPNSIFHQYNRNVFSYYEKINFILDLSEKYKSRITYIDCDWISNYNQNLKYDTTSLYTYRVYPLTDENVVTDFFTDIELKLREELLSFIKVDGIIDYYIPEALISLPYINEISEMKSDSKILQKHIEKIYDKNNKNKRFVRYVENGIGYCEGWGITALSIKYNIPVNGIDWRRTSII